MNGAATTITVSNTNVGAKRQYDVIKPAISYLRGSDDGCSAEKGGGCSK